MQFYCKHDVIVIINNAKISKLSIGLIPVIFLAFVLKLASIIDIIFKHFYNNLTTHFKVYNKIDYVWNNILEF